MIETQSIYILAENISIEVASEDLPLMTWSEAREQSLIIGNRWRLPEVDELKLMFKLHKKAIGNFGFSSYWSQEGINNFNATSLNFGTGNFSKVCNTKNPPVIHKTRLVRNF
jgi:hypothetical protein